MSNLAPIVLFVYNRPEHTRKTIQALQNNTLSFCSELFIYSDAAKNIEDKPQVEQVRGLISEVSGFKKISIVEQDENIGLANSIIEGVTELVKKYGRIIVLEDDLVTSPYFLKFMNSALDYYSEKKEVWHISGWNYPIEADGLADAFLWRVMICWGWATWSDRWEHFEKDTDSLIRSFSSDDIKSFNLDGYENFWGQVLANKHGEIDSWAIYWYAAIFRKNGLCLNPAETFVQNIGLDGSGVHCGVNASYLSSLSAKNSAFFEMPLAENSVAVDRIKIFCKKTKNSFAARVIARLSRTVRRLSSIISR